MEDTSQVMSQGKSLPEAGSSGAKGDAGGREGACGSAAVPDCSSPVHPPGSTAQAADCRECLGALSHRLAQPLTALRGGLELGLLGKRSITDYQSLLEQSLQLADDLGQMIVSLRDLGESGAPGGQTQPLLLQPFVAEILAETESLAQARELRFELQAEANLAVAANPERLRDALRSLFGWVVQNSAGPGTIDVQLRAEDGQAHLSISPPRLDLQYLQIKILADITNPGLLFSHAARSGTIGWAIIQRLLDALGGKLELVTEGPHTGCIRVCLLLARSN
jgi:K+-sensing histidine kinase KdpD